MGTRIKSMLVEAISKRMTPYESNTNGICAKATILDPRFKKCAFGLSSNASSAVNELIIEIQTLNTRLERNSVVVDEGIVERQNVQQTDLTAPIKKRFGISSWKKRGYASLPVSSPCRDYVQSTDSLAKIRGNYEKFDTNGQKVSLRTSYISAVRKSFF
ncbi:hypothetical protein J6590_038009 [Homalodisca vitripennis]|nr:hypothetical protein J6590_038009 [Homalodisca vitripennis]